MALALFHTEVGKMLAYIGLGIFAFFLVVALPTIVRKLKE